VGCDFVQVAPAHYMVSSNDEVFEHFKAINDNVDIGIMAYNTLWAMPAPDYDFNENGLTRFLDLENVEGVKWSTHDQSHFMTISRLFADKFSFIDNQATQPSLPIHQARLRGLHQL
jgi:4-hydroxy-tetrahydrodipicolinate synthase